MSTLAEIEAAVERLPRSEQEELLAFVAERIRRGAPREGSAPDPFADVVGAFSGERAATGRNAEKILYGKSA